MPHPLPTAYLPCLRRVPCPCFPLSTFPRRKFHLFLGRDNVHYPYYIPHLLLPCPPTPPTHVFPCPRFPSAYTTRLEGEHIPFPRRVPYPLFVPYPYLIPCRCFPLTRRRHSTRISQPAHGREVRSSHCRCAVSHLGFAASAGQSGSEVKVAVRRASLVAHTNSHSEEREYLSHHTDDQDDPEKAEYRTHFNGSRKMLEGWKNSGLRRSDDTVKGPRVTKPEDTNSPAVR